MKEVNNKNDLIKLIQENPNLPLVFMMVNDEIADDYTYTSFEKFRAYKSEVYKYEQWGNITYTDDRYDVFKSYARKFYNEKGYKELSDEDFKKAINEYIDKSVERHEAIVIYIG